MSPAPPPVEQRWLLDGLCLALLALLAGLVLWWLLCGAGD